MFIGVLRILDRYKNESFDKSNYQNVVSDFYWKRTAQSSCRRCRPVDNRNSLLLTSLPVFFQTENKKRVKLDLSKKSLFTLTIFSGFSGLILYVKNAWHFINLIYTWLQTAEGLGPQTKIKKGEKKRTDET